VWISFCFDGRAFTLPFCCGFLELKISAFNRHTSTTTSTVKTNKAKDVQWETSRGELT